MISWCIHLPLSIRDTYQISSTFRHSIQGKTFSISFNDLILLPICKYSTFCIRKHLLNLFSCHNEKACILWVLDHPLFWMLTLRTKLIFKLWERMFGVRTLFSASLDRYLASIHGIFPSYLTTKRDILAKHIRKRNSFEIVWIYRDCLFYYNCHLYKGHEVLQSSFEFDLFNNFK